MRWLDRLAQEGFQDRVVLVLERFASDYPRIQAGDEFPRRMASSVHNLYEDEADGPSAHEMLIAQFPPMVDLRAAIAETSAPLAMRMRAVYYLRTIASEEAVDVLAAALLDRENTPLMRHELAYVLGQIRNARACPTLEAVLADERDDAMVRHESAEALGAIGEERSLELLQRCAGEPVIEVAETCRIASEFVRWKRRQQAGGAAAGEAAPIMCACMSPYSSHDPAPADPEFDGLAVAAVGAVLCDPKQQLFRRYGAMFALRNRGGEEAVRALGEALVSDASSALLRHEVAFVLGQMQHPAAIEPLSTSLERTDEHSMVRHESAEALGAIEGDDAEWARCEEILRRFLSDHDPVVVESCQVALDAAAYWQQEEPTQSSGGGVTGFAELKRMSEKGAGALADPVVGHFNIALEIR